MAEQTDQTTENENVFCAHCGTVNVKGSYACGRCGERLIEIDSKIDAPMGLVSCARCGGANATQATFCWVCGSEMNDAIRISPEAQPEPAKRAESHRVYRPDLNPAATPTTAKEPEDERPDVRGPDSSQPADIGPAPTLDNNISTEELVENTSGTKNGVVPQEIKRWNWAAFLMPSIWGMFSGVPLAVLLFGAVFLDQWLQFAVMIAGGLFLGFKGNELAWRGKKWRSVAHFKAYQKQWRDGSIRISLAVIVLFIIFAMMQSGG